MSMEQPGNQDSPTDVPEPDEDIKDELPTDPPDRDDENIDPPEEEDDEIEVDGKKFVMPKSAAEKLKSERLMHADYTQKTQAVAAERKAVAAERQQVQEHQKEAQQYIDDLASIRAIDQRLAEFNALNWDELIDMAPQEAMKLQKQQENLMHKRNEVAVSITQKQEQARLKEQQSVATQIQEADAYFKREIPGWTNERSNRVQQYAIEQGIPNEELFKVVVKHPALAKMMHKAELFDQLEKKQSVSKPKPAVQEKPVTRITASRGSAQRDPDKMPMNDWLEWRNAQRSKKR